MSETKKRTVDEIQQEYTQLCARAGHLQYNLHTLTADLELLNGQLRDLNFEASKAAQAAKEEAAAKAAEPTTTAPAEGA